MVRYKQYVNDGFTLTSSLYNGRVYVNCGGDGYAVGLHYPYIYCYIFNRSIYTKRDDGDDDERQAKKKLLQTH